MASDVLMLQVPCGHTLDVRRTDTGWPGEAAYNQEGANVSSAGRELGGSLRGTWMAAGPTAYVRW